MKYSCKNCSIEINCNEFYHRARLCLNCEQIEEKERLERKCKRCNGTGFSEELIWDRYGSWNPVNTQKTKCPICNGLGFKEEGFN